MNNLANSLKNALPAALVALLIFGAVAYAAFQEPKGTPAGLDQSGNATDVAYPLAQSSTAQNKHGDLWSSTSLTASGAAGYILPLPSIGTGAGAGWFTDPSTGLTTVVAQQMCLGSNTTTSGDICTTQIGSAGGSCKIDSYVVSNIPATDYDGYNASPYTYSQITPFAYTWNGGNQRYYDFCQWAINNVNTFPFTTLKTQIGWMAVGADACANRGGSSDSCDTLGQLQMQCYYIRLDCGGTPQLLSGNSSVIDSGGPR